MSEELPPTERVRQVRDEPEPTRVLPQAAIVVEREERIVDAGVPRAAAVLAAGRSGWGPVLAALLALILLALLAGILLLVNDSDGDDAPATTAVTLPITVPSTRLPPVTAPVATAPPSTATTTTTTEAPTTTSTTAPTTTSSTDTTFVP